MLAMHLVEHLQGNKDQIVLHHFCDSTSRGKIDSITILKSLLWQILDVQKDMPRMMMTAFQTQGAQLFSTSSAGTIRALLEDAMQRSGLSIAVVLDGLDECEADAAQEVVQRLRTISTSSSLNKRQNQSSVCTPKICVFSRTEQRHELNYVMDHAEEIDIVRNCVGQITADLTVFINTEVSRLATRKGWNPALKEQALGVMLKKAEGSFLWVSFVVLELRTKANSSVIATISELPSGLRSLYDRIMDRVNADKDDWGRNAIQIVFAARRPLRVEELLDCVALWDNVDNSQLPRRPQVHIDGDALVTKCYGLIRVHSSQRNGYATIQLCHASVTDHLCNASAPSSKQFKLDWNKSHHQMAKFCMHYVERALTDVDTWKTYKNCWLRIIEEHMKRSTRSLEAQARNDPIGAMHALFSPLMSNEEDRTKSASKFKAVRPAEADIVSHLLPRHPFFWYACRWWPSHAQCAGEDSKSLFQAERPLLRWFHSVESRGSWDKRGELPEMFKVHSAQSQVEVLLMDQIDSDPVPRILTQAEVGKYWWSVYEGLAWEDKDIVPPFNVLHLAGQLGVAELASQAVKTFDRSKKHMMRELLDGRDKNNVTPLIAAARNGNAKLVGILLDMGASTNLYDIEHDSALHHASLLDHVDVVRILLRRDANTSWTNIYEDTSLTAAIKSHASGAAEQLMQDRSFLHMESGTARYSALPLHTAASCGDYGTVVALLSLGADVNMRDKNGDTALHVVSRYDDKPSPLFGGHAFSPKTLDGAVHSRIRTKADIAQLLLDSGLDKSARNDRGQTPLIVAAACANLPVVEILVHATDTAYVNAVDKEGISALLAACYQAHYCDLAKFEQNQKPREAFGDSIPIGHPIIVQPMMLRHSEAMWHRALHAGDWNARLDKCNPYDDDIYLPIVRTLIKFGADVFARVHSLNALHLACFSPFGAGGVVREVLRSAPELLSQMGPLGLPAHHAVKHGCARSLDCLFQFGQNFDVRDPSGRSLLYILVTSVCSQLQFVEEQVASTIFINLSNKSWSACRDADSDRLLHQSLLCPHRYRFVEPLVSLGANRMLRDERGNIPLHYAAVIKDGKKYIELLMRKSTPAERANTMLSLQMTNSHGKNALTLAVINGLANNARVLLQGNDQRNDP